MNSYSSIYNAMQWQADCPKTALPADTAVTMAYVPYQTDSRVYCAETALKNGTLFPSLDKPFFGGKCR